MFLSFTQNWIDPKKPLLKYVAKDDRQNCKLQFRVKFYVTDPSQLLEDSTRHQFYLQIRRDIFGGHLECPVSTQYLLASYIVQGTYENELNEVIGMEQNNLIGFVLINYYNS